MTGARSTEWGLHDAANAHQVECKECLIQYQALLLVVSASAMPMAMHMWNTDSGSDVGEVQRRQLWQLSRQLLQRSV